jgi:predicted RNA-binding protein with RPS1 domain
MKNETQTITVDFLIGAFPDVQHETTTLALTRHAVGNITPSTLESNYVDSIKSAVARQQYVEKKFVCITNVRLL